MKTKHSKFLRTASFSQMFLLIFSIVAFSYAIGSEVGEVSGLKVGTKFTAAKTFSGDTNVQYEFRKDGWWYKGKGMSGFAEADNDDPRNVENILKLCGKTCNEASSAAQTASGTTSVPTQKSAAELKREYDDSERLSFEGTLNEPKKTIDLLKPVAGKYSEVKVGETTLTGTVARTKDGYELKTTDDKIVKFNEKGEVIESSVSGISEGASVSSAAITFNSGMFAKEFFQNFLWTIAVYQGTKFIGGLFGIKDAALEPLSKGAALGFFIGSNLNAAAQAAQGQGFFSTFGKTGPSWLFNAQYGTLIGFGAGAAYFLYHYREVDTKTIQFNCIPWQAPTGGNDCEKCNAQKSGLPCSEYQCRSLGQSCELVNKGTTKEICAWVNRNDVTPPILEAFREALLSDIYKYAPDNAILPPDRGVKIEYSDSTDKCIPAFTPLRLGVSLNEPARCKIDSLRKDKFENMTLFMDQGLYLYNHTFSLALPGTDNLNSEGITVQNDGEYQLFVRCEDSNGNANIGTFVFKYCVQKGPDTTPPLIVSTSIPNNMPVAFNQSSVELQVYVNEPAECKWSHNNRDYNSMEKQMSCDAGISNANSQGLYPCATTLDGLKDRVNNQFFFRCKDKPASIENERNENAESFQFTIIGTQTLVIDSVAPNETIKDSTTAVKATIEARTSAGFDRGNSTCYYSDTGEEESYVQFFNTNSFRHSQDLFLSEAFYTYYIKCIDLGGNTANETVNFDVETDNSAPVVARAYHEDNYMKLITDEDAQCVYDNVDCNYPFSDGIKMTNIDGTNHFTDWNIKTNLYVKCKDTYGNEPLPNQCSITVKSSNL